MSVFPENENTMLRADNTIMKILIMIIIIIFFILYVIVGETKS